MSKAARPFVLDRREKETMQSGACLWCRFDHAKSKEATGVRQRECCLFSYLT